LKIAEFIGNTRLINLFSQGRLPPSALFTGPDGVGKRTLALLLAARANCKERGGVDLCGICQSCRKVLQTVVPPGTRDENIALSSILQDHPDIVLVRPGLLNPAKEKGRRKPPFSIGIDTIRLLDAEAHYRPFESRHRFFVVDEAEKMTTEAANSLLKTLEEPPSTTSIILVTAFPQQLLPTIRSRCQNFVFLPLSRTEIVQQLTKTTDLENPRLRACFSYGSIGRALELDLEAVLAKRDQMLALLEAWISRPTFQTVFERCEKHPLRTELRKKTEGLGFLDTLLTLFHDVYYLQVDTSERVINEDQIDRLQRISQGLTLEDLRGLISAVGEAQQDIKRNVNPRMCFETLWLGKPKRNS
jgi:DNA polymerase-3 subunit delta'